MGLFDKYTATDAPQPFTVKRWPAVLDAMEIKHLVDEDDGECLADWDDMRTIFGSDGEDDEIMRIRAYWHVRPPMEAYPALLEFANEWNADHIWPRTIAMRLENDAQILMGTDLNIDLETGATDDFLRMQVTCFISTSGQFFSELQSAFPEYTGWVNLYDNLEN